MVNNYNWRLAQHTVPGLYPPLPPLWHPLHFPRAQKWTKVGSCWPRTWIRKLAWLLQVVVLIKSGPVMITLACSLSSSDMCSVRVLVTISTLLAANTYHNKNCYSSNSSVSNPNSLNPEPDPSYYLPLQYLKIIWWYNILDLFLSPWIRTRIPNPDPKHCQTISLPCSQHVPCHRMLTKSHSIGTGTLERGSSLHRTFSEGTDRSYSLRVLDEKLYNQLVVWRCDNKTTYKWSTAGYI